MSIHPHTCPYTQYIVNEERTCQLVRGSIINTTSYITPTPLLYTLYLVHPSFSVDFPKHPSLRRRLDLLLLLVPSYTNFLFRVHHTHTLTTKLLSSFSSSFLSVAHSLVTVLFGLYSFHVYVGKHFFPLHLSLLPVSQ